MNKKEMSEIRKHFGADADFFTINSIATAFIDKDKNIRFSSVRPFVAISHEESEVAVETLKKVLATGIGRANVEYAFPNCEYAENGAQNVLYNVLKTKMKDADALEAFFARIAEGADSAVPYAVISAHCTYSVRSKSKLDEYNEDADCLFDYILTALCPIKAQDSGLMFDFFNDEIINSHPENLLISKAPADGFLFPTFSERATDINHVMYYTKKPGDPNENIIERVLGCEAAKTFAEEKTGLKSVLENVLGDELDLKTITEVNERIAEIVEENKIETEPAEIDGRLLKNILGETGVSAEKLEYIEEIFEKTLGKNIKASSVVETKTVISTPEITVSIKKSASERVNITENGGRRTIVIDVTDDDIKINGYEFKQHAVR